MKTTTPLLSLAGAAMLLAATASTGCIRSEELNAECDILAVHVPGDITQGTPDISNAAVKIYVKGDALISHLAPEFTLTEGATIDPPSGTERNFRTPQTYVVTSQDGQWHKTYTVSALRPNSFALVYNFENTRQYSFSNANGTYKYIYDIFYEVTDGGEEEATEFEWATGNPGFAMTGLGKEDPTVFPTYQGPGGVEGSCAVLTTRVTGAFGRGMNAPIAAGNLFIGSFLVTPANPAKSTHFGRPFDRRPLMLSGYYKYAPGEVYMQLDESSDTKLREVPGKEDQFTLYSVLYERESDADYLDGTTIQASPKVVARAEFSDADRLPSAEWRYFELPFVYYRDIDPARLANGDYSITIVMSSSIDGNLFSGAPGSTLMVDSVELTCEDLNDDANP